MTIKQKTIHYLYKTICLITKRYYIGIHSTNNLEDGYMGSGKRLRYSLRKYGKENHVKEILEFFNSRESLVEKEKEAVTKYLIQDKNCMNLVLGGGGFMLDDYHFLCSQAGGKASAEKLKTDKEYRERQKEWTTKNGTKMFELGHFKRADWTGKNHSKETKNKMSLNKKGTGLGKLNSQSGTMWITNGIENKKIIKDENIPENWCIGRTQHINSLKNLKIKIMKSDKDGKQEIPS